MNEQEIRTSLITSDTEQCYKTLKTLFDSLIKAIRTEDCSDFTTTLKEVSFAEVQLCPLDYYKGWSCYRKRFKNVNSSSNVRCKVRLIADEMDCGDVLHCEVTVWCGNEQK